MHSIGRPGFLVICALTCSCGGSGSSSIAPSPTPQPSGQPTPVDFGPSGQVAPPTDGMLPLSFTLEAQGQAPDRLADFEIRDNVGTLSLDGAPHAGVVYETHPNFGSYDVYDVLSVAQDGSNLGVSWLYCNGDALEWAWTLSYRQTPFPNRATGSCRAAQTPTQTRVRLPALSALPPARPTGFSIDGPEITLGAAVGSMRLGGQTYDIHPLGTVDCSWCPGGSWYEIHCLFRRRGEAGFGILYLFRDTPTVVTLDNALMLPTLVKPYASFEATWSGQPVAAVQGWFTPPDGPTIVLSRPLPRRVN